MRFQFRKKVSQYSEVVYSGGQGDEYMPNRMSKWYAAVGFEEKYTNQIQYAACLEIAHRWEMMLKKRNNDLFIAQSICIG